MKTRKLSAVRRAVGWSLAAVVAAAALGPDAIAQSSSGSAPTASPKPASPTYKSLVDKGFEIKDVGYLSDVVSTRLSGSAQPDTVLITLQKGPTTATCWFNLAGWQQHNVSALTCNLLQ